jgi:hypothetical protein
MRLILVVGALIASAFAQNTSTVINTQTVFTTACPASVTNCPGRSTASISNTTYITTTSTPTLTSTIAASNLSSSPILVYSNSTMTAPTITAATSEGILTASGEPAPHTFTSYYVIPLASSSASSATSAAATASVSSGAVNVVISGLSVLTVVMGVGYSLA